MAEKKVYQAIRLVAGDLAKDGIQKNRDNNAQGFKFRGIDDVYNVIADILVRHGLDILPTYSDRVESSRVSSGSKTLFFVSVKGTFTFVSCEDGSSHDVVTYGEAMDSGDKATNKAMAAAHKYAILQTFHVPTEGHNDPDEDSEPTDFKTLADGAIDRIFACGTMKGLKEISTEMSGSGMPKEHIARVSEAYKARMSELAEIARGAKQ